MPDSICNSDDEQDDLLACNINHRNMISELISSSDDEYDDLLPWNWNKNKKKKDKKPEINCYIIKPLELTSLEKHVLLCQQHDCNVVNCCKLKHYISTISQPDGIASSSS